jgi:hypothetical protein
MKIGMKAHVLHVIIEMVGYAAMLYVIAVGSVSQVERLLLITGVLIIILIRTGVMRRGLRNILMKGGRINEQYDV